MLKIIKNSSALSTLIACIMLLQGCAAVVVGTTAATGAVIVQDRRTAGTIVEDKSIQLKAVQAISDITRNSPDTHVSAVSYNNRVLLIGQTPSRKIRTDIQKAVKNIQKVNHVHNEISLKERTSLKQRSTDSWITTKIKSEMALTKDLNPTRVKVITEDGIVYLMGITLPQEAEMTIDIARHTKGVKKVVKIFEYG